MIEVKIKICGITNLEDAQAAIDMGADILGFNFYARSPRYIEPARAAAIIRKLPSFVDTAGVFVNVPMRDIHHLTTSGMLNWVQFHGDETPDFCRLFSQWNIRTIKAVRVQSLDSVQQAAQYQTFALLFDAYNSGLYGGTGQTSLKIFPAGFSSQAVSLPKTSVRPSTSASLASMSAAESRPNRA